MNVYVINTIITIWYGENANPVEFHFTEGVYSDLASAKHFVSELAKTYEGRQDIFRNAHASEIYVEFIKEEEDVEVGDDGFEMYGEAIDEDGRHYCTIDIDIEKHLLISLDN